MQNLQKELPTLAVLVSLEITTIFQIYHCRKQQRMALRLLHTTAIVIILQVARTPLLKVTELMQQV
jgi:hypothetical protein